MAKYSVKFEIEVIVNEPDINTGEVGDVVYDEKGTDRLTDARWNEIVCDAVAIMEDISNCVTEITRVEDEDED